MSSAGTSPTARIPAATGPEEVARRVKLRVQRVDPWSVCKMAVLFSVAAGIAGVAATMVLWLILQGMGVFSEVNTQIQNLIGSGGKNFTLDDYVGFSRVLSLATVVAVVNVVIMTAIATLAAFLYNVCAGLVGGVQMTLTDD